MTNKAAAKADTEKVISKAKKAMQEISETFAPESYSPEFRAEISKDIKDIKDLAERIKAKVKA
jgi:ABC-type enterochelin transport system substrate-binding protein